MKVPLKGLVGVLTSHPLLGIDSMENSVKTSFTRFFDFFLQFCIFLVGRFDFYCPSERKEKKKKTGRRGESLKGGEKRKKKKKKKKKKKRGGKKSK